MYIDWDEAPEGFDYALTTSPEWGGAPEYKGTVLFAKKTETSTYFECSDGTYPCVGPGCWEVVATRPQKWNGEGIPPIGSKVEFYSDDFENEDYWNKDLTNGCEVEIIAHITSNVSQREEDLAVFVFEYSHGNRQVEQAVACCFRPIKTKEQIAAEERESEVSHIERCITNLKVEHQNNPRVIAEVLHNIGYRKQENTNEQA